MSIAMSADKPVATPPSVTAGAAGLPAVAGANDGGAVAATPFDAALQACLAEAPDLQRAAADEPAAGRGEGHGDDPAAPSAEDEGPSSLQGMPALLMTLLPSSQALAPVAVSMTPPHAAAGAAATQSGADGAVRAAAWPVGGDGGAGPALAFMLAAGQGALRPQQAAQAPVSAEAPQSATAPAVATGTSGPGLPSPEGSAAAVAPSVVVAGDAGRQAQADGVDRPLSTAMPPIGSADTGAVRSPDTALRLPNGDANQWRQPLMQALGERLQFASERGIDSAVIRLEPPRMGSIEIAIRHQDGALQINLSATHNEVLRQLQDISDTLRHNLGQRHAGDVTVQVAEASASRPGQGDGERQRQRQAQAEQNPGRALGDAEAEAGRQSFRLARNEE